MLAGTALAGPFVLVMAPSSARANCTPAGATVNCAPPGTGGFIDGNADGLTVTVQPGTTVTDNGTFSILVRDNNVITNNGTVQAAGNATAIRARNDNIVTNNGTVQVVNGAGIELSTNAALPPFANVVNSAGGSIIIQGTGTGILVGNDHRISNAGSITGGTSAVGIAADNRNTVSNTGWISVGPLGSAVQFVTDGNTLNNFGMLRATGGGFSIEACACTAINNTFNNLAGGTMDGKILVLGEANAVSNAGTITVTDPAVAIDGFQTFVIQTSTGGVPSTFSQTAAGTLAVRMNNAGAVDNMLVDTVASLAGTLRVVIQNQLYPATLTSANAAVELTGAGAATIAAPFTSYTSSSQFFRVTPVYVGGAGTPTNYTQLFIRLDRIPFNAVSNLPPGQTAIANALEAAYSPTLTGNAAQFFANIFSSTAPNTFQQLSGQGVTASQGTAFASGSMFNVLLLGQSGHWLSGGTIDPGGVTIGGPTAYAADDRVARGHDAFARLQPDADLRQGRWRVWALGFGARRSIDGDAAAGTVGQSQSTGGGAIGLDRQVRPDLLLGVAGGASDSSYSAASLSTTGRITAGHFGLYGMKTWGPLYATAALSYARLSNRTSRTIAGVGPTEIATADFPADQFSARVELGWRSESNNFAVTPFVAAEPSTIRRSAYGETSTTLAGAPGVFALNFTDQTTNSLPTFAGLQFEHRMALAGGAEFMPLARVSWVHEFITKRSASATFATVPTAAFTVDGQRAAEDAVKVDAGMKLALRNGFAMFANWTGEYSNISRSNVVTAGIRQVW